jgi:hypothetical protein
MAATTRPLGIEVYNLANLEILKEWQRPECPKYTGMHGMRMPIREAPRVLQ